MILLPPGLEAIQEELAVSLGGLNSAIKMAFDSDEAVLRAKEELAKARSLILIAFADNPKELGSNEAAREAKLADLTSESAGNLRVAEMSARHRRLGLEEARLQHGFVRDKIRLCEVAVGMDRWDR